MLDTELQQMKQRGLYCGQCKASDCDHLVVGGIHYENPWIESKDATPTPQFDFEAGVPDELESLQYDAPDNHPPRQKRTNLREYIRPLRP